MEQIVTSRFPVAAWVQAQLIFGLCPVRVETLLVILVHRMAFPAPSNVVGLGEQLGAEPTANVTFEEACVYSTQMNIIKTDDPIVSAKLPGIVKLADMPFKDASGATHLKHFIDIITDYTGDFDLAEVTSLAKQRRYADLPLPLRSKITVEKTHTMNLIVLQNTAAGNGTDPVPWIILRMYSFEERIPLELVKKMCHGIVHQIDYGSNFRSGSKAVLYMWERMGGYQVRHQTLRTEGPKKQRAQSELMKGFDHIKEAAADMSGPSDNKFVIWTECQISDEASPVFGWDRGLVMSSLKNHHGDDALVQEDKSYPLTLAHLAGWYLDEIVVKLAPYIHTNSIIMLGLSGKGKTPASIAIGKAGAFHHIDADGKRLLKQAAVRISPDLDFFRGQKGSKYISDILDDPELAEILISKLKAFLAVDQKAQETRERWGASTFVKNQCRLVSANEIDDSVEPKADDGVEFGTAITHKQFVDMIRSAFSDRITRFGMNSLLKRSVFIVNTMEYIYLRLPSEAEVTVRRLAYPVDNGNGYIKKDFLSDDCKEMFGKWKDDSTAFPEDHEEKMEWSLAFLKAAMAKQAIPRTVCTFREVDGETVVSESKPSIVELKRLLGPPGVAVFSTASSAAPTVPGAPDPVASALRGEVVQSASSSSSSNVTRATNPKAADIVADPDADVPTQASQWKLRRSTSTQDLSP